MERGRESCNGGGGTQLSACSNHNVILFLLLSEGSEGKGVAGGERESDCVWGGQASGHGQP